MKLASLVAVQGIVKEPPPAGEGRGAGRHEPGRERGRPAREATPAVAPSPVVPPLAPSRARSPQPVRASGAPLSGAQRHAGPTELQQSLGRLRQAFRDVAAVVEGVGALRSLGGEEALIEMAMFAQSHEQSLERVWKALADCEEVARRLAVGPPPSSGPSSVAPANIAPASVAPLSGGPPSESGAALTTDPAPMPPEDLADDPSLEEDGPVTQVDAPPTRVLVVDDDPAVLRAFRRVLQSDHDIVTARDGSEALRVVLSGARVDAIICDIGMPKLDGPAFFSELFELRPQLMPRVVFCTGGPPNEKTQRFLERLQAPLLFKPVAAADLQRAIDMVRAR